MGLVFKAFSLTYALWWSMTCAGENPCWRSPIKWTFILLDNCEPRVCQYLTTTLPWQTSLCLFLCLRLKYINWYKLGFRYGCFAMKDHWQPRLIDISTIILEILVLIFAPWLDSKNSNKFFLLSSFSMYPFACGVFVYVVWTTTTFACLVEWFLFNYLAQSYNWTWGTWTWNVRLKLKDYG
jgi:hypothetical protein